METVSQAGYKASKNLLTLNDPIDALLIFSDLKADIHWIKYMYFYLYVCEQIFRAI